MKFKPHDYQAKAKNFLMENPKAALIADMGLGKTVTCLDVAVDLILDLAVKGILVVAPLRVTVLTWPIEIESWEFSKFLTYSIIQGPKKAEAFDEDADIYLINYESMFWLIERLRGLKPERWPFDMIIFDELTRMKSHRSKRFKRFKKYVKYFNRRIGLTGTPTPQGYMDLFAQYFMLDNGERLGTSFDRFKRKYFYPEDYMQLKWSAKEGTEDKINARIEDITLRISQEGNLELPPCNIEDIELTMNSDTREIYRELEATMFVELESGEVEALSAASLTNKCHQACGGGLYTDSEKYEWEELDTVKIDKLKGLVKELAEPVLVAYSYRHEAERIKRAFPEAVHMKSGLTEAKQRELLERWNRGGIPMLLCHPASAGHGLNLQKGSRYAIWYSLSWSLEYYLQLNKRLHRQGQKRPVTIFRLLMSSSTDLVVASCLERKECTQEDFLNAIAVFNKNRKLL